MDFRELYVAELKAIGFFAADADEIADWYCASADMATFPSHCRRIALAVNGYDPSQPRNADGEWTAGGGARPREHRDKGFQDRYGNGNPETLAANPKMNMERGKAVISHILANKSGYEPHAMYRADVGWIGVDYGVPGNVNNNYNGGHGIAHIIGKHEGAIDGAVDVILNGTAYKHDESRRKIYLIKDRTAIVLSKNRDGRLLITDFEKISDRQFADYTSKGKYHARGENE